MTHTHAVEFLQIGEQGQILSRQQSTETADGRADKAWKARTLAALLKTHRERTHLSAGPCDSGAWELEIREDYEARAIPSTGAEPFRFTTITRHEFRTAS